jgi:hypothetical protein
VRGDAGTFPQSLALLDSKQQSIYHPRGALTLAAGCDLFRASQGFDSRRTHHPRP